MHVHLINPSDMSFGTAVITPRWLYVLAAATPAAFGDAVICDETLELVNNYLDEEKVKEVRDELAEIRQLARDEAAAEGRAKAAVENPTEPAEKPAAGKKKTRKKASPQPAQPAQPQNPAPAF